jgi:hypothetical protein
VVLTVCNARAGNGLFVTGNDRRMEGSEGAVQGAQRDFFDEHIPKGDPANIVTSLAVANVHNKHRVRGGSGSYEKSEEK